MNSFNSKAKKVAFITGAGRGIGRAIAKKLASNGYLTVIVARTRGELDEVAKEIDVLGGQASVFVCDITDRNSIQSAVSECVAKHGGISVLVNAAGRSGGGHTENIEDTLWMNVIDTNLNGVFFVTKAVLRDGNMQPGGAIINIASTGGKQGVMYGAPYSASKHGVVGFTKALGLELAKKEITVNAVCPGFVETDMANHVRNAYAKIWGVDANTAKSRIEQRIPIGRYIEPGEVADLVSYLASPSARGITAQAINVCGGLGNY